MAALSFDARYLGQIKHSNSGHSSAVLLANPAGCQVRHIAVGTFRIHGPAHLVAQARQRFERSGMFRIKCGENR